MWHDLPNSIQAGPPTFVPRPGADEDDEADGVLLVDCLASDGRACLVVLDGRRLRELARVVVPYRHTLSYGSSWVWA